jgi:hypothetical protein
MKSVDKFVDTYNIVRKAMELHNNMWFFQKHINAQPLFCVYIRHIHIIPINCGKLTPKIECLQ